MAPPTARGSASSRLNSSFFRVIRSSNERTLSCVLENLFQDFVVDSLGLNRVCRAEGRGCAGLKVIVHHGPAESAKGLLYARGLIQNLDAIPSLIDHTS